MTQYDALVVGGGPAGLSAGLWLARYRRHVRILDSGRPRNSPTWAVHGYPGLPDVPPHELRRALIEQATAAGAEWEGCHVESITGEKNGFVAHLNDGRSYQTRRIVLAYGRFDVIPEIEGLRELYGISVFHCPDCDGPSMLGSRVGVFGWDRRAAAVALYMLTWANAVTLLTNGEELQLEKKELQVLEKYDVAINHNVIARLCAQDNRLAAVEFDNGDALPLDGMFFHFGSHPAADIAGQLGCRRDSEGNVKVDHAQQTSMPGVYAAGDLTRGPYIAVIAAASGVKTGLAVHKSLLPPDQEL